MNEYRFNACCDGCYRGSGCENGGTTESGGEFRYKSDQPKATSERGASMTSKPSGATMKLQINDLVLREGAYYLFDNGSVAGPAIKTNHPKPNNWNIGGNYYGDNGRNEAWPYRPQVVQEVTITPVVPVEPKRRVVWVNFYGDMYLGPFKSKTKADEDDRAVLSTPGRIACQKFELIEGVFDDEE